MAYPNTKFCNRLELRIINNTCIITPSEKTSVSIDCGFSPETSSGAKWSFCQTGLSLTRHRYYEVKMKMDQWTRSVKKIAWLKKKYRDAFHEIDKSYYTAHKKPCQSIRGW